MAKNKKWLYSVGIVQDDVPRVRMQSPGPSRSKEAPYNSIPEGIARLAYEQYSYLYGTDQSFERLHERGGFGMLEIIGLLADLVERERSNK